MLHRLLQMSAQETFLSDYYLFGVSPFLVELKNLTERVLEGIEVRGEKRTVIPHHRLEAVLKERLQGSHCLSKINLLDRHEEVKEFWNMKAWTDQMVTLAEKDSSAFVHQFVGDRLEGIHFLR